MSEETWWLIRSRGGQCGSCREHAMKGTIVAYRHGDRAVRCQVCIDAEGIVAEKSKALRLEDAQPVQQAAPVETKRKTKKRAGLAITRNQRRKRNRG